MVVQRIHGRKLPTTWAWVCLFPKLMFFPATDCGQKDVLLNKSSQRGKWYYS